MNQMTKVNRTNTGLIGMMTLFLGLITVEAVSDSPTTSASEPVNTVVRHTASKNSKSIQDITTEANRWGLSVSDYRRYTEIIQGPLGHWNPQIDPVLALGIYADNEADKRRYAEIYAQQEYELTQRTLAFEQAYRAAFSQLYPDATMVDKQLLQPYYENQQLKSGHGALPTAIPSPRFQAGDRILYFPKLTCQDCGEQIAGWLNILQSVQETSIDIYVVGADHADQVRHWAIANTVKPAWIKEGVVTLNVDSGLSKKLAGQVSGQVSSLYLSRDQSLFALNPEQLSL